MLGDGVYQELEDRITVIMQQVHQKLVGDGKTHNLIREIQNIDKQKTFQIISPYEEVEIQKNYHSVITGVVEFFELFSTNASKVEHIFYELFSHLGIKTNQKKTFFNSVHYKVYCEKVIESPGLKEMIEEVRRFQDESEDLKQFFEKIDQIKELGKEALKPDNSLSVDFETFYANIEAENKINIIQELEAFVQHPMSLQLDENFENSDEYNSGRKTKGKKKQKRPENF